MRLSFTKMHGLGNDFIVIDSLGADRGAPVLTPEIAIRLADRRLGIGADQILWLKKPREPQSGAVARMEIFNTDGSIAEMCGNGIRAVALYLDRKTSGGIMPGRMGIETLAGLKSVEVDGNQVTVDMGPPVLGSRISEGGEELLLKDRKLRFHEVSMGNPHAVIFVGDFETLPASQWGPLIENHPRFPRRTNVEFVRVVSAHQIEVQVWERGAGITLACGTGACASAVAAMVTGRVLGMSEPSAELEVKLPGGMLGIRWAGQGHSVLMKGPAVEVFRGEIELGANLTRA